MPRTLLVIGIGAGDPDQLTVEAINALNSVEVFFVFDKENAAELTDMRRQICERYIRDDGYRVVEIPDPPRDRGAADYAGAVRTWRDARTARLAAALETELGPDGRGAILVWGDPALYDGTIRIIETILEQGRLELDYQVIPGISSVQLLTARHRIPLNQVARPVHITTGRRLLEGLPPGVDDVVVMLDAGLACAELRGEGGWHIYWGAYLGTKDEALVAGPLDDVLDEIQRTRREMRERKGWIMDTYLLRRAPSAG
ncbi:MAG TPA: precorrin-6A synthase (deacetylating) [Pseudonocardia sp.]|nr:precorrin-6A synthase (deacetylating) [Pseudonocardia sp.]